jgi:hypothetical protein
VRLIGQEIRYLQIACRLYTVLMSVNFITYSSINTVTRAFNLPLNLQNYCCVFSS